MLYGSLDTSISLQLKTLKLEQLERTLIPFQYVIGYIWAFSCQLMVTINMQGILQTLYPIGSGSHSLICMQHIQLTWEYLPQKKREEQHNSHSLK